MQVDPAAVHFIRGARNFVLLILMQMAQPGTNRTSQHILGAAANLLGFCLFVITALHFTDRVENNLVDEFTSLVALLLTLSSVLSFMSIRSSDDAWANRLEKAADYIFLVALLGIFAIITFMTINFWMQ